MIDVVYLAWNRLEFTAKTFPLLIANTDWSLVRGLYVYDDGSTDGTRQFLDEEIRRCPVEHRMVHAGWHSPPAMMNHYIENVRGRVDRFAKIDSDCCTPPGWLATMNAVLDAHPEIELLGSEAGMTRVAGRDEPWDGSYGVQESSHIGGIGLMRLSAFQKRRRIPQRGRFGFTEWQHDHEPGRGWITPDLPMPLLDRMPIEPWLSLSERYIELGWQRSAYLYDKKLMQWAWDWIPGALTAAGAPHNLAADVARHRSITLEEAAEALERAAQTTPGERTP